MTVAGSEVQGGPLVVINTVWTHPPGYELPDAIEIAPRGRPPERDKVLSQILALLSPGIQLARLRYQITEIKTKEREVKQPSRKPERQEELTEAHKVIKGVELELGRERLAKFDSLHRVSKLVEPWREHSNTLVRERESG